MDWSRIPGIGLTPPPAGLNRFFNMFKKSLHRTLLLSACLILASISGCGRPEAPSEPRTDFLSAKGNWTAKKLVCTASSSHQKKETRLPMDMTLSITDKTIGGTVTSKKCTMTWSSRIKHVTPTQVRVWGMKLVCPKNCDARLCDTEPTSGETELGYRLERSVIVMIQDRFSTECDPGEIYFSRN